MGSARLPTLAADEISSSAEIDNLEGEIFPLHMGAVLIHAVPSLLPVPLVIGMEATLTALLHLLETGGRWMAQTEHSLGRRVLGGKDYGDGLVKQALPPAMGMQINR
mmetsp:Transcript_1906/g.4274  ORF Transcript_1906/g.4274 Transcript_1906/m.4274 type:complete len:107 (-) Transcript_1906:929-1249(-)